MSEIVCQRFPVVARTPQAATWLRTEEQLGKPPNTMDAYSRGLEEYLEFCKDYRIEPVEASREDIALYVNYLFSRPKSRKEDKLERGPGEAGLSNNTLQQRITVVRLFYSYLIEEGLRDNNPVGRGRYTPGNSFGDKRGLIPRYKKLPWIPTEEQWSRVLAVVQEERVRNRLMLAFAYDAGLRREELCSLQVGDIDPSHRRLRIRAETTKGKQERVVPYSESTDGLYRGYLQERRRLSRLPGPLFLSESRRNLGKPITFWTWSKVTRAIAERSDLEQFTSHTLRHLCLTDLARCGWDIHEIARFAGHKSTDTTLQYIHLSARDLGDKLERGMSQIHTRRAASISEDLC